MFIPPFALSRTCHVLIRQENPCRYCSKLLGLAYQSCCPEHQLFFFFRQLHAETYSLQGFPVRNKICFCAEFCKIIFTHPHLRKSNCTVCNFSIIKPKKNCFECKFLHFSFCRYALRKSFFSQNHQLPPLFLPSYLNGLYFRFPEMPVCQFHPCVEDCSQCNDQKPAVEEKSVRQYLDDRICVLIKQPIIILKK